MSTLNDAQISTVTVLLQSGKTIKEISKFAGLERNAVTQVARSLDIEPATPAQRRAKELFAADVGHSYQEIAETLRSENLKNDDGKAIHYLTVSTWTANHGWRWGGSSDGDYVPPHSGSGNTRPKYALRVSKSRSADMNSPAQVHAAVAAAWENLTSGKTDVVQLAVILGAGSAGVTDIDAVRKSLLAEHGETIKRTRV